MEWKLIGGNELKRTDFFKDGGNPVIYMLIKMIQEGMKNC